MITYCVTGHRPNNLGGFGEKANGILFDYAVRVLKHYQPSQVISGMALGWDIAIARAAISMQIPLIAAVPFREQDKKWFAVDKEEYNWCLSKSQRIVYVDEIDGYGCDSVAIGKYAPEKMQLRNKWMVDNSDGILALWRSGKDGGTKNCIDYANKKYSFPKNQIIYLWENYLEYRNEIGEPLSSEFVEETDSDVLVVDVLQEITNAATEEYESDYDDDDEIINDLAEELLGDLNVNKIVYPYQLNPDMEFSPYNAVYNDGKRIHVDESYLEANLDWVPDFDFQSCSWEPKRVPDYRQAKILMLDIETLGFDATKERIVMIGLLAQGNFLGDSNISESGFERLQKGHILELQDDSDESEKALLTGLFRLIDALQPDAIATHNGYQFDFPYIMTRCEILGVNHPMTRITDKPRRVTAASIYGQIPEYYPVYWTKAGKNGRVYNDGSFVQLIDTYYLAGQHDKIFANMTKYSLKYLAHYVKFRKEKRLEIGDKVREYWLSREPQKIQSIRDYLIFDLEDQKAVTNFFLLSSWYQQMYFPLPLQELSVASPARKHNANLEKFYRPLYNKKIKLADGSEIIYQEPISDEKLPYDGALVDCKPGVYTYFFSLDVSSMYPSWMLRCCLMSRVKDPLGVFLKTIYTLRELRYAYKDLCGDNPHNILNMDIYKSLKYLFEDIDLSNISKEDKQMFNGANNSFKVGINGGYGAEGVGFYKFNDMESAALITAYGRITITKMRKVIETYAALITLDTDGIKATPKLIKDVDPKSLTDTYKDKKGNIIPVDDGNGYVNPVWIWQATQSVLPDGIVIDLEQTCPTGAVYAPAMKNYIFWEKPNEQPKLKGVFRKRNRSELQKEFPIEFIRLWAFEGKNKAHEFSNDWVEKVTGFRVSFKNILRNVVIKDPKKLKGEEKSLHKLLINSNCGEIGDDVFFYWGARQHYNSKGGKRGKKPFPILRCPEGITQQFPCDESHIDKKINIEKYVSELSFSKEIPYTERDNLNELIDSSLIEKLMFTVRIPKESFDKKTGKRRKNKYVDCGLGSPGDTVSFYWASIKKRSQKTGAISKSVDEFPVRIIVNDDDSIKIDLQSIPDTIDKSLINLSINLDWYIKDLLKIRNEILDVVDK